MKVFHTFDSMAEEHPERWYAKLPDVFQDYSREDIDDPESTVTLYRCTGDVPMSQETLVQALNGGGGLFEWTPIDSRGISRDAWERGVMAARNVDG